MKVAAHRQLSLSTRGILTFYFVFKKGGGGKAYLGDRRAHALHAGRPGSNCSAKSSQVGGAMKFLSNKFRINKKEPLLYSLHNLICGTQCLKM